MKIKRLKINLKCKLKKVIYLNISLLILLTSYIAYLPLVKAAPTVTATLSPTENQVERESSFYYNFYLNSAEHIDVGVFRLILNFDNSKVKCKGIYPSESTTKDQLKYNIEDDTVTIIFIDTNGVDVFAKEPLNVFSIKFDVLDNADFGTIQMQASIDSVADSNANEFNFNNLELLPAIVTMQKEADCTLKSLSTSEGAISPEFNPYITNYTLDVLSTVDRIETYAQANDETATVTVNRKTLNKAGSSTEIKITVKSANKKSSLIYTITVNRLEKTTNSISNTNKKTTASTKTPSSKKTSSTSKSDTNNLKPTNKASSSLNNTENKNSSPILVNQNRFWAFLIGVIVMLVPTCGYWIYTKHKKYIHTLKLQSVIKKVFKL